MDTYAAAHDGRGVQPTRAFAAAPPQTASSIDTTGATDGATTNDQETRCGTGLVGIGQHGASRPLPAT